jgi:hypothetical protein
MEATIFLVPWPDYERQDGCQASTAMLLQNGADQGMFKMLETIMAVTTITMYLTGINWVIPLAQALTAAQA